MSRQIDLFLRPESGPRVPTPGDWVQRLDDKRIGRVRRVIAVGDWAVTGFERVGDIVVQMSPGHDVVTSGGAYFWTRWERVDPKSMAQKALDMTMSPEASHE